MAVDKIINVKIDLNKVDPTKLFKSQRAGKDGKFPLYLDATILFRDEKDQYENNGMIIQDVSKEDRAAGIKGNILGNVKQFVQAPPVPAKEEDLPDYLTNQPEPQAAKQVAEPVDDLPF
jgi:hypothetical protein